MATADQAHGGKDRFADHFGLFRQLRSAAAADWEAYVRHPFVRALADGSLPEECFRHYLIQDYLFLGHLARAYGLASFKAENLDDLRAAADALNAIINKEMHLHLDYCGGWGLTAADAATAAEAPATIAYTRFVLDRGVAGDLLDLWVALTPCVIGYAEIGAGLAADPKTGGVGNPYRAWIETYAGSDYQAVAWIHGERMESLMARRGGPSRIPSLIETFRTATRLETAFWDMGLASPAYV
ncbi:MAG: thiaminase II [Rhodospirillales bacterium]